MTQHNEVVEAIYESALEPTRWPSALSKISSNLDVVDATIVLQDTHPNLLVSSGHDAEYIEYLRDWRDLDIIRSRVSDTVPVGHIYADWQMITDAETRRDPFYQDFRRRYGVHHLVGRVDRYSPGKVLRFAVQLPAGREPPGSEFVESFGQVANHVCRAFELSSRLAPGAAYVSHFGQELSRSRYAAAILDSEGRVVFANGRFTALGAQGLDIRRRLVVECERQNQSPRSLEAVRFDHGLLPRRQRNGSDGERSVLLGAGYQRQPPAARHRLAERRTKKLVQSELVGRVSAHEPSVENVQALRSERRETPVGEHHPPLTVEDGRCIP